MIPRADPYGIQFGGGGEGGREGREGRNINHKKLSGK